MSSQTLFLDTFSLSTSESFSLPFGNLVFLFNIASNTEGSGSPITTISFSKYVFEEDRCRTSVSDDVVVVVVVVVEEVVVVETVGVLSFSVSLSVGFSFTGVSSLKETSNAM